MKALKIFSLVFFPLFFLVYAVTSKVVISGREQAGQEALRPNQISDVDSGKALEKR